MTTDNPPSLNEISYEQPSYVNISTERPAHFCGYSTKERFLVAFEAPMEMLIRAFVTCAPPSFRGTSTVFIISFEVDENG